MHKIKPILLLCVSLFVCNIQLAAQAVLDPTLPAGSQPLVKHRVLHFLPTYASVHPGDRLAPLSARQKFHVFAGETFDPSVIVIAAFYGGIGQAGDFAPNYGQGWGPYGQRVGSAAASFGVSHLYTEALLPTLFHQDPRYFRKGSGSKSSRFWYAISRTVVTPQDSGRLNFNYSLIGGLAAATATSNIYHPPVNRTAAENAKLFGAAVGLSALANLAKEFAHARRKP
jgi:hypothetical protein